MTELSYGMTAKLSLSYEEAVERVREALKAEGFGVLTEVDVRKIVKEKLGADFEKYIILGACNPSLAHSSLQSEHEIGLLLPCNVVVHEEDEGSRVSILDPLVMVQVTGNQALQDVAQLAREKLERSLESLRLG